MKVLKSCVSVLVLCALLFVTMVPAFAADSTSPYEILLKKGFPSEFLDLFSDEMLLKILNMTENSVVSSVHTETAHLQEAANDTKTRGTIATNTLDLQIGAVGLN